jgi:tetratricopeptide (TPR) repeat protein
MNFHSPDQEDIPVAQVVDTNAKPVRSDLGKIAIVLGIMSVFAILFLSVIVATAWFGWTHYASTQARYEKDFVSPIQLKDTRWERIRNTLKDPSIEVDTATVKAIESMIRGMYDDLRNENLTAAYKRIDQEAFFDQMDRSQQFKLNLPTRRNLSADFRDVTSGPEWYDNFHIISIEELGDSPANEFLVYLYAWDDNSYNSNVPIRFWVKRDKSRWKISDWEKLNHGISEATEYAVLFDIDQNGNTLQNYYDLHQSCYDAEVDSGNGDDDSAKQKLDGISTYVDKRVRPSSLLRIANAYIVAGYTKEAIDTLNKARNPERAPGIFYRLAQCHQAMDRPDEAIRHIDQYLKILGFTPQAMSLKAEILASLDRKTEAINALETLANTFPEDRTLPRRLRTLMDEETADRIVGIAGTLPKFNAFLRESLSQLYTYEDRAIAEKLISIVKEDSGDAALAFEAEASLANTMDDFSAVANNYMLALSAADSRDEKLRLQDEYVNAMDTIGRVDIALQKIPFPIEAMKVFADAQFAGDMNTDNDQMESVASTFCKSHPESAFAKFAYGASLWANGKYSLAEIELRNSLPLIETDSNLDSESKKDLERRINAYWRNSLVDLGRIKEACFVSESEGPKWESVSSMIDDDDVQSHRSLLKIHESETKKNPELKAENDIFKSRSIVDWANGDRLEAFLRLKKFVTSDLETYYVARSLLLNFLSEMSMHELQKARLAWAPMFIADRPKGEEKTRTASIFSSALLRAAKAQDRKRVKRLSQFLAAATGDSGNESLWLGQFALATRDDDLLEKSVRELNMKDSAVSRYVLENFYTASLRRLLAVGKLNAAENWLKKISTHSEFTPSEIVSLSMAMQKNDDTESLKILERWRKSDNGFTAYEIMNQPRLSRYFSDENLKAFREQNPRSISYCRATELQFLYQNKPKVGSVVEQIEQIIPNLKFKTIERGAGDAIDSNGRIEQRIAWDGEDFIFVCCQNGSLKRSYPQANDPLPKHQWVLTVGYRNFSNSDLMRKFESPTSLLKLAGDDCVAAHSPAKDLLIRDVSNWIDKGDRAQLPQFPSEEKDAEYLYFASADGKEDDSQWWKQQNAGKLLGVEILENGGSVTDYEIKVDYSVGSLRQSLWFPLVDVRLEDSSLAFIYRQDKEISILPLFPKGELCQISNYSFNGFRKKEAEK